MTDERKAFEAWAKSRNFNVESFKSKDGKEEYCWPYINGAWQGWQARGAQQEPVAYRFKNNRGNGKFDYAYYDADQVATAYRDNCLEITPLFASPLLQPDSAREPTEDMIEAGINNAGGDGSIRDWCINVYKAMISAQEKV
jgi:hypothetical protein